jgi:multiple sugar transport system ATP-binding protein
MNLVETSLGGDAVSFGGYEVPLDRERRPRFARAGHAVLGIRPEAFEDAEFAPAGLPQIEVRVEVVEELGSDAYVFFEVDAPQVVVDEAVRAEDEEATLLAGGDRALFAARVDPRSQARVGAPMRLAVDPSRLYFFAPESGETLLGHAAAAA